MQALNSRSRVAFASWAQPAAGARRSVCVCVKPTKAADFAALSNEEIVEKISTLKKARGNTAGICGEACLLARRRQWGRPNAGLGMWGHPLGHAAAGWGKGLRWQQDQAAGAASASGLRRMHPQHGS